MKNLGQWRDKSWDAVRAPEAPLHWRKPRVVRVTGDLFHESLPDADIVGRYAVMARCQQHRFVVLTKRAERRYRWHEKQHAMNLGGLARSVGTFHWPLPNVIECISASTQVELEERWGWLERTPAARRGLHLEPLVEPVDVLECVNPEPCDHVRQTCDEVGCYGRIRVDWVVVGGETGPGARPMAPEWVRRIRDDCQAAGVPFWLKQLTKDGRRIPFDQWPRDLQIQEMPDALQRS